MRPSLAVIGSRPLPEWALRLLRHEPVAVIPGLTAPLVVWPAATYPARLIAALAAVA